MSRDHCEIIYAHALYELLDEIENDLVQDPIRNWEKVPEPVALLVEGARRFGHALRVRLEELERTVHKSGLDEVEKGTY